MMRHSCKLSDRLKIYRWLLLAAMIIKAVSVKDEDSKDQIVQGGMGNGSKVESRSREAERMSRSKFSFFLFVRNFLGFLFGKPLLSIAHIAQRKSTCFVLRRSEDHTLVWALERRCARSSMILAGNPNRRR